MKSLENTDIDVVLVKLSGIALFTVAIIKLPTAISALMQIGLSIDYFEMSADAEGFDAGRQLGFTLLSNAIGNLLTFVLLVIMTRWVFGYPKILRKWLNKSEHRLRD